MRIKTKLNLKIFFVFVFLIIGFLCLRKPIRGKALTVLDGWIYETTFEAATDPSKVGSYHYTCIRNNASGLITVYGPKGNVIVSKTGHFEHGTQYFPYGQYEIAIQYSGTLPEGCTTSTSLSPTSVDHCTFITLENKKGTCTTPGYLKERCKFCGQLRVTKTKPEGHKWVKRYSNLSCNRDLMSWEECSVCGKTKNIKTIFKAPGHHFEELVNDKRATCTTDGRSHYRCTNVINGVRCTACSPEFTVPKTGHYINRDEVTKKPTVYTHGERVFYCKYCNAPVTERDIPKRKFNVYVGNKRVKAIYVGDKLVWNGSVGDVGTDGGKDTFDEIFSLIENNWYYKKHHYNNN